MTPSREAEPLSLLALRTELADIEHQRWSDWQAWCHGQGEKDEYGNLIIPQDTVRRWEKQINTPYCLLTAREQASDIEQVDRYWPLIAPLFNALPQWIALAEAAEGCDLCSYVAEDPESKPCAQRVPSPEEPCWTCELQAALVDLYRVLGVKT